MNYFISKLLPNLIEYLIDLELKFRSSFKLIINYPYLVSHRIVREWNDCKALVDGFPNNEYKKYNTWHEAQAAFLERSLIPEV